MRKALMLLIVLMISLVSSGCFHNAVDPLVEIRTVYVYNVCPKPEKPEYFELDSSSHLGSAYNINILIGNTEKMKTYNGLLLDSIECYEKQTKEGSTYVKN